MALRFETGRVLIQVSGGSFLGDHALGAPEVPRAGASPGKATGVQVPNGQLLIQRVGGGPLGDHASGAIGGPGAGFQVRFRYRKCSR